MCRYFNKILNSDEKKGGSRQSIGILQDFTSTINCCNMKDLKFKGNPFGWVGKREKKTIESCLERVFIMLTCKPLFELLK